MKDRLLEDFADIASDWFWETGEDLRFTYFSSRFQAMSGIAPKHLLGRRRDELETVRNNFDDWKSHIEDLEARRPFQDFLYRTPRKDGSVMWVRTSGRPIFDEAGSFKGYRGVASNMSAAHETAEMLEKQNQELSVKEAIFEQVQRMASIGAWSIVVETGEMDWSEEIYKIFDLPTDQAPTLSGARGAFSGPARKDMLRQFFKVARQGGRIENSAPFVTGAGRKKWIQWIAEADTAVGPAKRIFGTFQDVTEDRERSAVMKRLAHTDSLTGLANRTMFQKTLKSFYDGKRNNPVPFLLFLIDIDHFKHVNDFHGHDAGDMVLRFAARQLLTLFGEDSTVARLGGDELAVICPQKSDLNASGAVSDETDMWAQKIKRAFGKSLIFHGNSIELSVSVGIAIGRKHGCNEMAIMRAADLALYRSKRCGRDRATVYEESLSVELNERSQTLGDFRKAAAKKHIMPYYQPIVDLATGKHLGFEALLRWDHPSRGLLAPGAFECVFEDTRSAQMLTNSMVQAIADDLSIWDAHQLSVGKISLNLSGADLRDDQFIDLLFSILERTGLKPDRFVLEVTENVIFGDKEADVVERINRLSETGVEIALDDFGTGFASLTHLQVLPVDIVKIDKSFILKPDLSAQDLAILKAIIDLGSTLGFSTVAEGIEQDHHCKLLRLMGCERGQGYLFSRPISATDVPNYLLKNIAAPWPYGDDDSENALPTAFIPGMTGTPVI